MEAQYQEEYEEIQVFYANLRLNKLEIIKENNSNEKKMETLKKLKICIKNLADKKREKFSMLVDFLKTTEIPMIQGKLTDLMKDVDCNDDDNFIEKRLEG